MADHNHLINIRIRALEENVAKKINSLAKSISNLKDGVADHTVETRKNVKQLNDQLEVEKRTLLLRREAIRDLRQQIKLTQDSAQAEINTAKARQRSLQIDKEFQKIAVREAENDKSREKAKKRLNELERKQISVKEKINQLEGAREKELAKFNARLNKSIDYENHWLASINRTSEALKKQRIELSNLNRGLDRSGRNINTFRKRFNAINLESVGKDAKRLERDFALLGRAILGLLVAGVIVFSNSLASSFVALGGQAIAAASSIAYLATTIGGVLVSGISQALPMVGILAAAFQRLSIIQQAVQQADLIKKQSFGDTSAEEAQADATDQIADAQRGLQDAQENLTEARADARRELEDLILAERQAELAARGAVLSQADAKRALAEAVRTGDVEGIAGAELDVQQSNLGVRQSRVDLRRAAADADKARRGGISQMESVKDATRGVEDATRALARAHEDAAKSATEQTSAESSLAFFLDQLSPAEKELFRRLQDFRKKVGEAFRPITDIIIRSFTFGLGKVEDLLLDDQIIKGVTRLAEGMGDAIKRISTVLTTGEFREFFVFILKEGAKNLGPLTDGFIALARIWIHIARAAAPIFRKFLRLIVGDLQDLAESTSNTSSLTDFFEEGFKHFQAWYKLLGAVLQLFGALMNVSGDSFLDTLTRLTETIQEATGYLEDNQKAAKGFFAETAEALSYIGQIIVAFGKVLVEAFDPKYVQDLAEIFINIFIPAIGAALKVLGTVLNIFAAISSNPIVNWILKAAVAFGLIYSALSLLFKPFRLFGLAVAAAINGLRTFFLVASGGTAKQGASSLAVWLGNLVANLRTSETGMRNFGRVMAGISFVAILAGLLILTGRLDDVGRAIESVISFFRRIVAFIVGTLLNTFDSLESAIKSLATVLGLIAIGAFIAKLAAMVAGLKAATTAWNALKTAMARSGIGAIAVAIGTALVALGLFNSKQEETKVSAQQAADAIQAQVDALRALKDQELVIKGNRLGVLRAEDNLQSARQEAAKALQKHGKNSEQYRDAVLAVKEAQLTLTQAQLAYNRARKDAPRIERQTWEAMKEGTKEVRKRVNTSHDVVVAIREEKRENQDLIDRYKELGASDKELAPLRKEKARIDERLAEAQQRLRVALNQRNASEKRLNSVLDESRDKNKDYGKEVGKNTKKVDEQRASLRKILRPFNTLGDTLFGTAEKSRGMGQVIGDVTNNILAAFGAKKLDFKLPNVKSIIKQTVGGITGLFDGAQRGGYFGDPRERGPDDRLVGVAGGEAMLTGWHQMEANRALATSPFTRFNSLGEMFARDRRPHATAPRYQTGGFVQVPSDPYKEADNVVSRSVVGLANWLVKRFKLDITAGYDPDGSHVSPGHNITGTAIDIIPGPGGGWGMVGQAVKWATSKGMTVGYDGSFGSEAWAGHGPPSSAGGNAHAHFELRPGLKGGGAGGFLGLTEIPKLKIGGPEGPLKDALRGQANRLRSEANRYIAAKTNFMEGPGAEGLSGIDGPVSDIFAKVVRSFRAPYKPSLALFEAGIVESGMKNLAGGHSSSTGALQLLASTAAGLGVDPRDPAAVASLFLTRGFWGKGGALEIARENPGLTAGNIAQLVQGSAYPDRYDQVQGQARALMRSEGLRYKGQMLRGQRGLMVPQFGDGGIVPGPLGAPRLVGAHGGEMILPTHKFQGGGRVGQAQPIGQTNFPNILGSNVLGQTFGALSIIIHNISRKFFEGTQKATDRLNEALLNMFTQFEVMAAEIEKITGEMARRTLYWIYEVRNGVVVKTKSDLDIARRELKNLVRLSSALNRKVDREDRALQVLRKRLAKLGDADNKREIKELKDKIADIEGGKGDPTGKEKELLKKLKAQLKDLQSGKTGSEAIRRRLEAAIKKLEEQRAATAQAIADNMVARFEAQLAVWEAMLANIERGPAGVSGAIDLREARRGEEPRTQWDIVLQHFLIHTLQQARRKLLKALRKAIRQGNTQLVADIEALLSDNAIAIEDAERTIIDIGNEISDRAIEAADRTLSNLDAVQSIFEGIANLGGVELGGEQLLSLLNQRYAALVDKRWAIEAALAEAIRLGQTDRIADLQDQLLQNFGDFIDLANQMQDAHNKILDDLVGSFDTSINNLDIQRRILEVQAQLAGAEEGAEVPGVRALLEERGRILQGKTGALEQALADARSTGQVDRIADLETQLLNNQLAILENTLEIKNLTEATVANTEFSFRTTSWQMFRSAVLNGIGGILPQFAATIPHMQSGGTITKDGLFYLHAGEKVTPSTSGEQTNIIQITEPMEVADPTALSSSIAWQLKQLKAVK